MLKLGIIIVILVIFSNQYVDADISEMPILDWDKSYYSQCGQKDFRFDGDSVTQRDVGSADCVSHLYLTPSEGLEKTSNDRNLEWSFGYNQMRITSDAYTTAYINFKNKNDDDYCSIGINILSSRRYNYRNCEQGIPGIAVFTNIKNDDGTWSHESNISSCHIRTVLRPAWDQQDYNILIKMNNGLITVIRSKDEISEKFTFEAPLFAECISNKVEKIRFLYSTSGWYTGTEGKMSNLRIKFDENQNDELIEEEISSSQVAPESPTVFLSEYQCYKQIRETLKQTETDYWITARANTDNCPPGSSYKLETDPDVIVNSVSASSGKSFSAPVNTTLLYSMMKNYTVTIQSKFSLYFNDVLWFIGRKKFTWNVDRETVTNTSFKIDPFIVDDGEEVNEVIVSSNVDTCADINCYTKKSNFYLDDMLAIKISPDENTPNGLKLGVIETILLNDERVDIDTQGKYSNMDLWGTILLNTVCSECILNITASVVPEITTGRRLLDIGTSTKRNFFQKINVEQNPIQMDENPSVDDFMNQQISPKIETQNTNFEPKEEENNTNSVGIIAGSVGLLLVIVGIVIFTKKRRTIK